MERSCFLVVPQQLGYVGCDFGVFAVVADRDDIVAVLSILVDVLANLASC